MIALAFTPTTSLTSLLALISPAPLALATAQHDNTISSNLTAFLAFTALFFTGVIISSAFGGIETACYTLSRLRLFLKEHAGNRSAVILHDEIRNMPRLITTVLIGNNLGNYISSFALTAVLSGILKLSDPASITLQALLLTPFLFLFAETIPKEFCRIRAESVVYPAAPLLRLMRIIFTVTGVLPLVTLLSGVLVYLFRTNESRTIISARLRMSGTLHEGVNTGLLSLRQMNMVERFLETENMNAGNLMTPWLQIIKARTTDTPQQFLNRIHSHHHRYCPLVNERGEVMGIISVLNIIRLPREQLKKSFAIQSLHEPVITVNPRDALSRIVRTMRAANAKLAVVGPPNHPLGIITRKDLLEPLITTTDRHSRPVEL